MRRPDTASDEIIDAVARRLKENTDEKYTLADVDTYDCFNGGLVSHGNVGGDVPLENIEAMLDEMLRDGTAVGRRSSRRSRHGVSLRRSRGA